MTKPQIIRNVYCTDPEDRVIAWTCPCCKSCWKYVTSKHGLKNGRCPFGGPFEGYVKTETEVES
jgi:hypothetical protein